MKNIMRIEKYLSNYHGISRTNTKKLIRKKKISVNDIIIKTSIDIDIENDVIQIQEFEFNQIKDKHIYILLNKPFGYVCANKDSKNPTVFELLDPELQYIKNLHTVGRLDIDTEGVLIITNDGNLTHELTSPKNHVLKIYYVEVDNEIPYELIAKFAKGIKLNDFTTKPALLQLLEHDKALLTISEGKFHQVKRMFAHFGLNVTYLNRVKFGDISAKGLTEGEYRLIDKKDILSNLE
ncbi:pseudouridine synthase [Mycoplasma sp. M5725]|uniref:Pseudouridine synthase n=1 Tax=Mycoplasma phocimorsus TaxID=3045839 RepID=A0AAJ1PS86_9MOLU|nr:pseudouridine synthase [Mycoplasma phocimorsus]MDJ1645828.1 pseudouridine synthase [Mycoplasma phocimorsus]